MFANGVFLNGSCRHVLAMHRNGIIHKQFYFQREGKLGLVVVERLNEWSQGGRTRFRGKRPHGGSLPRSASSGPCTAYRFSADAEFQISVNDRHAAVAGFSWPEPRAAFARLTPGYHIQLGESRTELQARLLQSSRPQPRWSEVTYTVHQVPGPGGHFGPLPSASLLLLLGTTRFFRLRDQHDRIQRLRIAVFVVMPHPCHRPG